MFKQAKLLLSIYFLLMTCHAYSTPWHSQDVRQNFVFALAGGPTWASPGQSQDFYLQNDVRNYYENNGNISNTFATGDIFLGVYHELNDTLQGQLGIELGYSGNAYAAGTIWQDANREYDNFSYSYNVRQFRTLVKAKLVIEDLPVTSMVQPYLGIGLGIGFNHAYNFQTTALLYQAIPAPNFSAKTTYAFTYTVGGGLQMPIDPFWQLGIGYEFADWGKNQLGNAPGQTENPGHGLVMQNLYTSTALITLTYTS